MSKNKTYPSNVGAALEYAARGWHVFPARIKDGTKRSHVAGKANGGARWGATIDPDTIRDYWSRWPNALVGIATGVDSGFFVIDVDTVEGHGHDGIGKFRQWIETYGDFPDTLEAITPSDGSHFYFRAPIGMNIRNSQSELADGIDVRGEGGMVLAPPTAKPGTGKCYHWKNPPDLFQIADAPAWLLDKLLSVEPKKREKHANHANVSIGADGANARANAALQEELAKLIETPTGGRNAALNCAAFKLGQIVAEGGLDEATVRERLADVASKIGLDAGEIGPTIESGLQAGIQEPRWRALDGIDLSHDALANDLGRQSFDHDARYVATWNRWLFWSGTRWQLDNKREHMTRTRAFLRQRAEELNDWADKRATIGAAEKDGEDRKLRNWAKSQTRTLCSKNTVAAIEALAQSNPAIASTPSDFDADRFLLGTPGGTVDLKTGELRKARRDDMLTKHTACGPASPGTRPERWCSFLNEIFDGDAELTSFMQRVAGYALTGETTEHKLLFLYGTGRNGKSVFLNTLNHIWGDYSRRAAAETFLNSKGDKHSTGLAGLQGARLVAGSELPVGKTWDESVIKDLTGGDRMTARYMRGDFFDFDPQLTLMIAGNNQPSFRGVDEAIRARVVLVPFLVTIPPEKRDKSLPDKLQAEGPAILRWAIEGALQWQERGLDVPEKIVAASEEYMDDEDLLGQFLADKTARDPECFVTTSDLHLSFGIWCHQQGLSVWTQHTLRKELKSRGYQPHRRPNGRGFIGLRII